MRGLCDRAGRERAATTFVHATFVQLTTPGPAASIRLRSHSTFHRVLSGRRRDPRLHQGLRVAPPTEIPPADDHPQEVVLAPDGDGWYAKIPVLGVAR